MSLTDPSTEGIEYDILVIEKNPSDYEVIRKSLLKAHPNFKIAYAGTWDEAKSAVKAHKYDRVFFSLDEKGKGQYAHGELTHLDEILKSGHEANTVMLKRSEDHGIITYAMSKGIIAKIDHPSYFQEGFSLDLQTQLALLNQERDGLTKLINKENFDRRLQYFYNKVTEDYEDKFLSALQMYKPKEDTVSYTDFPLSVMFIDLDGFKPVNDQYGHAAGDAILKKIGNILSERDAPPRRTGESNRGTSKTILRTTDVASRLGGDEFGVILTNTSRPGSLVAAEKVAEAITGFDYGPLWDSNNVYIGASIGVATYMMPLDIELYAQKKKEYTHLKLLEDAETAMRVAKTLGDRDRKSFVTEGRKYNLFAATP